MFKPIRCCVGRLPPSIRSIRFMHSDSTHTHSRTHMEWFYSLALHLICISANLLCVCVCLHLFRLVWLLNISWYCNMWPSSKETPFYDICHTVSVITRCIYHILNKWTKQTHTQWILWISVALKSAATFIPLSFTLYSHNAHFAFICSVYR